MFQVTIPVFERLENGWYAVTTVGLGPLTRRREGKTPGKVDELLAADLRFEIGKLAVRDLEMLEPARGTKLEHVRMELTLLGESERRKLSGVFPVIVEPRWASDAERLSFVHHPLRPLESFPLVADMPLDEQARIYFAKTWANLSQGVLDTLATRGKESLRMIAFSAHTKSLLDQLPTDAGPQHLALGRDPAERKRRKQRAPVVLPKLGQNLTDLAARGSLEVGAPRGTAAHRLGLLLGASKRTPAVVVGPPGSGKTTALNRFVADALESDGYGIHKNLDRCRKVWLVAGKRIIAGMSHVGQWEQRCLDLIEDARNEQVILAVLDLHHFGRIGRSRQSDRSLADLFRGPLARREIVLCGESTPEEWKLLEEEAPSFASLFTSIPIAEASRDETFRLLLHTARALEMHHRVEVDPFALRSLVDLTATLLPARALPGKSLDLLGELARAHAAPKGSEPKTIGSSQVIDILSKKTGMPGLLLQSDEPLVHAEVISTLERQVMGQSEAVRAMADLVLRIKVGATDADRPYGVYLFTGPTGTGKTELAKCMAELVYGSPSRLVRFDMSELSGPDAPTRLIGHRYAPEGLLTSAVQEQPFCVVLFDEIEKAHPSVQNLFLQLFEDGRLTDASGTTAYFSHTIVIMTSNLGGRARPAAGFAESPDAVMHDIARAVREFFAPELWNRIDRIVPFRPLSMETARLVAEKEIEKLLLRGGLADRNIFVARSSRVGAKVAEIAFRAEDGARSIKRYLEDTIGALLTTAITAAGPAAIQLLRIDVGTDDAPFRLEREALEEVEPALATFAVEPLLDLPPKALRVHLEAAVEMLRTLEHEGGPLDGLSRAIRDCLADYASGTVARALKIYDLESMRIAIASFRARAEEALASTDRLSDYEDIELKKFAYTERSFGPGYNYVESRTRLFDRRVMTGPRRLTKRELLGCIAESVFLERAIAKAAEPGQHAIFVELLASGGFDKGGGSISLIKDLWYAYTQGRGEVDSSMWLGEEGIVPGPEIPGWTEPVKMVVLEIVGLCVLDSFELEAGAHVLYTLSSGPQIVRVRVTPAVPGKTPLDVIEEHLERVRAFERGEVSGNPAALGRVARTIRMTPPLSGKSLSSYAIEDYATGFTERVQAELLVEALASLWLYASSRRVEGAHGG